MKILKTEEQTPTPKPKKDTPQAILIIGPILGIIAFFSLIAAIYFFTQNN